MKRRKFATAETPEEPKEQSQGLKPFESPYSPVEDPEKAVAYFEGVAVGFAAIEWVGTTHSIGSANYSAIEQNQLKQLACDAAWKAIDILRDTRSPELDSRAQALMKLVEKMPHQEFEHHVEHPTTTGIDPMTESGLPPLGNRDSSWGYPS